MCKLKGLIGGLLVLCFQAHAREGHAGTIALVSGDDIQAAIDAARPGDVVLLSAGRYPVPLGLTLQNGVSLRGESRDGTILDGGLDIDDPIAILEHLFLKSEPLECDDAADVDDDGKLLITDPIYLLSFLFLDGTAPRAPFPGCGADASPDGLGCGRFERCAASG